MRTRQPFLVTNHFKHVKSSVPNVILYFHSLHGCPPFPPWPHLNWQIQNQSATVILLSQTLKPWNKLQPWTVSINCFPPLHSLPACVDGASMNQWVGWLAEYTKSTAKGSGQASERKKQRIDETKKQRNIWVLVNCCSAPFLIAPRLGKITCRAGWAWVKTWLTGQGFPETMLRQ